MTIRTIEFIYHTSKYVLKRNQLYSYIHIVITIIQTVVIFVLSNIIIGETEFSSYFVWIGYAVIIGIITSTIVGISNILIYRKETRGLLEIVKKNLKRKDR